MCSTMMATLDICASEVQLKYKARQSLISQTDVLGEECKIRLACETRQSNTMYIQETVLEDLDCH